MSACEIFPPGRDQISLVVDVSTLAKSAAMSPRYLRANLLLPIRRYAARWVAALGWSRAVTPLTLTCL